jgi:hypothetical protein
LRHTARGLAFITTDDAGPGTGRLGGNRHMSGSTSKPAPGSPTDAHPAGYEPDAWHEAAARLGGSTQAPIPSSHHGHDLQHWPLRDTLILGALADAVPSARAHLR